MTLTKDQILATRSKPKLVPFEVPDWNGEVNIRKINGLQREKLEAMFSASNGQVPRAPLISYCLCDDTGKPLFADDDFDAINQLDGDTLTAIFLECMKHNGFLKADVDGAAKN